MEKTIGVVSRLDRCVEGYARSVSGNILQYPRMRPSKPAALIARASNGANAFEWQTPPLVLRTPTNEIALAVSAGIFGQEAPGKKFDVSVNGVKRFTFATSPNPSWATTGENGGVMSFESLFRDQFNDYFGVLRFNLPAQWLRGGEAATIGITGENAGSSAWVMVYEDSSAVGFLRGKSEREAYCDAAVESTENGLSIALTGISTWVGRKVTLVSGSGADKEMVLANQAGKTGARCLLATSGKESFRILVDGEEIGHLDSARSGYDESRIAGDKLLSRKCSLIAPSRWLIEYRSTYVPEFGTSLIELSRSSGRVDEALIMNSSHQDIAWMDTPDQCVKDRDEKVITPALALLRSDTTYRFDLEDVLELREFIGRHPERKEEIAMLILGGRLGVGATFNMPYEELCSGEMLVRQFYAGLRWLKTNFPGSHSTTMWNPDVPGRASQMPQIASKAGVTSLVLSRMEKGLYDWRGPDGSGISVFSPGHYALFTERCLGKPFHESAAFMAGFAQEWSSRIPNGSRSIPALFMSDMSAPLDNHDMIGTWNGLHSICLNDGITQTLALPAARYVLAEMFFKQAGRDASRFGVIRGERPDIWLYIHGPTHHRAISAKREADAFLFSAEMFATIEGVLVGSFKDYPSADLTRAWEAQIYPDHGWGGKHGEVTDSLFNAKYEESRGITDRINRQSAGAIAGRVAVDKGAGIPVVVFNSLAHERSGVAGASLLFQKGKMKGGIALVDGNGKEIPLQVISDEHYPDRSLKRAEIVFIAENLPSAGYATFYVRPEPEIRAAATSKSSAILESPYYLVTLAPGGIRQIRDKDLGADLLAPGKVLGNELFTMQSVGEDAGEWAEPQYPTMQEFDHLGAHSPEWRLVESGPVRDAVELRQTIAHATVVQRVIVYRTIKQIDCETSLLDWDGTKYREFRVAFPLNIQGGEVAYEAPFDAVEVGRDEFAGAPGERYTGDARKIRPRAIQNWIGASGKDFGVTISSSVNVWDFRDPTDSANTMTFLSPIMLASRKSCHWEGNWYLQKGDHQYRFSLTSHAPGWRNGNRQGDNANTPLTVVVNPLRRNEAVLPERMSFVNVGAKNAALAAFKKAEDSDDVIVRLYEDDGRPCDARVDFSFALMRAGRTNMIEEGSDPLPIRERGFDVHVGAHAIETFRVAPNREPASARRRSGARSAVIAYWLGDTAGINRYSLTDITHLQYSFVDVRGDTLSCGGLRGEKAIRNLVSLKREYPGLKILLSLGGWGGCVSCSESFGSSAGRKDFIASVLRAMERLGADGLDFDWEYPSIEGYPGYRFTKADRHNFTQLVTELRAAFGSRYEISFAAGGFQSYLERSVEWKEVMAAVDRVNLMSYDLVNGYSTTTGHQTALYSCPRQHESTDNAVRFLDSLGIDRKKIVIGSAFYARLWEHVDSLENGLFRQGKFKTYLGYNEFAKRFAEPGWTAALWDSVAHAPYRYNTRERMFATFDDARSVQEKCEYVNRLGLGGMMFWELHNDEPGDGLLEVIAKTLR